MFVVFVEKKQLQTKAFLLVYQHAFVSGLFFYSA